jgi:hypothetical protein
MGTSRRTSRQRDEGAVIAWVAIMLPVLIGLGALTIDVGALLHEKRQLQNGADAAALAVAQDCAQDACGSPEATAQTYADLNAKDGEAYLAEVCGQANAGLSSCSAPNTDGALGWVKVTTGSGTSAGAENIDLILTPILNPLLQDKGVRATAVAAWGNPRSASTLPFIICETKFTSALNGTLPSNPVIVYSKSTGRGGGNQNPDPGSTCPEFPGGGTLPGNFSWLDVVTTTTCEVELVAGEGVLEATSDQGNDNLLSKCGLTPGDVLGETFAVPLFETTNDASGNNLIYYVSGFAGFEVTGFRLSGNGWDQTQGCVNPPTGGNLRFFCGRFVPLVIGDGEFGGGNDYGVTVIKMVG